MHTVKSMRNDPELDEWPDEADVDEMEDVCDLFDLMEELDISSKDLESVSELASRIKMHIWCKKYGNYKQMVWVIFSFQLFTSYEYFGTWVYLCFSTKSYIKAEVDLCCMASLSTSFRLTLKKFIAALWSPAGKGLTS